MNHPLRKIMTGLILMAMSPQAFANDQNMKALFEQINKASKGALGSNVYQEPDSRRLVEQNGQIQYATSKTAFTAAFPSDLAAKLAAEEGLLLGHRFTTDYVALHKKFVAPGESATGFAINVEAFMSNPQIAPEMKNMVLQMILEKFYIGQNPNSKIAYGNLYRGSADADNERTFYNYFAKYLAKYQDPQKASDYLILFEMQRRFNLTGDTGSVSLESLRAEVASLYDRVSEGNKGTESDVTFMKIRNSIHNYMTPDVVGRLEAYLQKFNTSSGLSQGTIDGIRKLKARIETYYKVDKTALLTMAKKIPAAQLPTDFQTVLGSLKETGNTLQDLKKLSALVVAVVDQFKANAKNPEMIHFVIKTQAFLQNELARTKLDLATAQIRTSIAMDSIYASGLIPQSMYLDVSKVLSAQMKLTEKAQASALSAKLSGVLKQALALTKATFKPALDKWVIVSPQTEGVIDDTLRGSQMTELDQVITLLDGGGQTLAPGQMDVLMEGEAYGYLIYVPADVTNDQVAKLDRHSIAIFAVNPLFTGVLEATISEQYQGPLSHIKIKSDSRGTPNAFYPKASQDPMLKKFINSGKPVRISFSKKGGFSVTEVTLAEAKAVWDSKKKAATVEIFADLKEKRIRSTDEMGAKDFITVGAKTANYAEATHVLPEIVLKGWGIPFAYYKEFMETNYFSPGVTLQQYVEKLLKNPRMETDKVFQVDSLTALRARMTDPSMKVNPELVKIIAENCAKAYPPSEKDKKKGRTGRGMRLRSSTNSEDLPNFSGAGLYDSYAYKPGSEKDTLEVALRGTWSSVWNQRAYEEREEFGIPHLKVYMAILVSPGYNDEIANGVAVTRNIMTDKVSGAGVFMSTQVGSEAVTNPDPEKAEIAEALIVTHDTKSLRYVTYSSMMEKAGHKGQPIMANSEALQLYNYLMKLHTHFKKIVDPQNKNPNFAIDVEYKVFEKKDGSRGIFIKQARPYIGDKK